MAMLDPAKGPGPWALAGAGTELAGSVVLLALLGWWLDKRWGTSPWLLLLGTLVGTVGGIYNLWQAGQRFFRR
jgi:F0F1-type ATP synthase assembly protein I